MASDNRIAINRWLVGMLALGFLAGGGAILLRDGASGILGQSLFRIGIVLGALWIALPSKSREAAWARVSPIGLLCLLGAVLALTSKRYLVLAPILIALAILGIALNPRKRK